MVLYYNIKYQHYKGRYVYQAYKFSDTIITLDNKIVQFTNKW